MKIRFKCKSIFGFVWLILFLNAKAQNNYSVQHWTDLEGLSNVEDYFIYKDSRGFVWVSSRDGLNRFDGNRFKTYFPSADRSKGPMGRDIYRVVEDSLGYLWMGTNIGLSRYDYRADTFTHFIKGPVHSKTTNPVFCFWATKDEVFAVENSARIVAYNIHTLGKRNIGILGTNEQADLGPSLNYIYLDKSRQTLWYLSGFESVYAGLTGYDLQTGKKTHYSWPCIRSQINHSHTSEAMCFDQKRNCLWINSPDGLIAFSLATRQFQPVEAMREIVLKKDYARYVGVDIDPGGRVWFATVTEGLLVYDPQLKKISKAFPNNTSLQKSIADVNACIYCDRDGMVWTGSWLRMGVFQVIPYQASVISYRYDPAKTSSFQARTAFVMCRIDEKTIWVGSDRGIQEFIPSTGEFRILKPADLGNSKLLPSQLMGFPVTKLPNSNKLLLLMSSRNFSYDLDNRKLERLVFRDSSGQELKTPATYVFSNGQDLLVGCLQDNYARYYEIDPKSLATHEVFSAPGTLNSLFFSKFAGNGMLRLYSENDSTNKTIAFRNGTWKLFPNRLDSIDWHDVICSNGDSTYWVATGRNIVHLDRQYRLIRSYGVDDALPDLSMTALTEDAEGNIWSHTDRSVHCLNVKSGKGITLTDKDGLIAQPFELVNRSFKDENGEIYFCGGLFGNGLVRINPLKLNTSHPSEVYIRSVQTVGDIPLHWPGENESGTLELTPRHNSLAIETGLLDYYSKGSSGIRFRLVGRDSSWQFGSYYYTIRYVELKSGTYTLVIQGSNAWNEFDGPEKILHFRIFPPFWETWWFRLILVASVTLLVYGMVQFRSRRLLQTNALLEQKVANRTSELKKSLEELKETQAQLIHREKMASLGELTAGIAHEIQNPLNFVNNFSEVNKELIEEMDQEMEKGNLKEAKSIAQNIRENELKISQHGKRADSIVKGMLQHSRSSVGIKEPTDINALVDEYLRLSYHGMRAKEKSFNATIETHFDPRLGKINIISQDISRVMLNIYNNAFYAVHEKQIQQGTAFKPLVTVSTRLLPSPAGNPQMVEIRIRDNGMGIPQKVIDKIFQPFFTTKPTGEGTGLGLSLSYDIVTKMHGGQLMVDTRDGEYAEFIIRLPI